MIHMLADYILDSITNFKGIKISKTQSAHTYNPF